MPLNPLPAGQDETTPRPWRIPLHHREGTQLRVHAPHERQLLLAPPPLQLLLPPDGVLDPAIRLRIDEVPHAVARGERAALPAGMRPQPALQVPGDADVEDRAMAVGQDVHM